MKGSTNLQDLMRNGAIDSALLLGSIFFISFETTTRRGFKAEKREYQNIIFIGFTYFVIASKLVRMNRYVLANLLTSKGK